MLSQVRPKALIIAWIVDIVGSNLFGVALIIATVALGVATLDQFADAKSSRALFESPGLLATSWIGGLAFTTLAGYVAARIAGRSELLHGLLAAGGCVAASLIGLALANGAYPAPTWMIGLALVLSPLAGLLGGYLRLSMRRGMVAEASSAVGRG